MTEPKVSAEVQRSPLDQDEKRVIHEILNALRGLRFGSVEITVHEAKVTFIERKEKVRLV